MHEKGLANYENNKMVADVSIHVPTNRVALSSGRNFFRDSINRNTQVNRHRTFEIILWLFQVEKQTEGFFEHNNSF